MNFLRNKLILSISTLFLFGIISIFFVNLTLGTGHCWPAPLPGGDYSIPANTTCGFATSVTGGVNGVDDGNLIIGSKSNLVIRDDQTIVFNPGKTITGMSILTSPETKMTGFNVANPNQIKKGYLWMIDKRRAGYPDSLIQTYTATNVPPGPEYVRRSTLIGNGTPSSIYPSLKVHLDCTYVTDTDYSDLCPYVGEMHYTQTPGLNVNIQGWIDTRGHNILEYWPRYGTTPNIDYQGNRTCDDRNNSNWTAVLPHQTMNSGSGWSPLASLSGLNYGTKYYYCFMARNTYGIWFGESSPSMMNFITPPSVITEYPPTNVTPTSVKFNGSITAGNVSTTAHFEWGLSGSESGVCHLPDGSRYYPNDTAYSSVAPGNSMPFYADLFGLSPGTNYAFCAVGSNGALSSISGGTIDGYGIGYHFTTPYTLIVDKVGSGSGYVYSNPDGISCGSYCTADFYPGTNVGLGYEVTVGHSRFAGWSGDCPGSCNVNSHNMVARATFIRVYTLETSADTGGSVSPSGSNTYDTGTNVSVVASPSTGYYFDRWSGNCSGGASTSITMNSDKNCTARFARYQYTLTTSAGTGGSVSGGGTYYHGDTAYVTATPSSGYYFSSWSSGNCSGGASTSLVMNSNKSCTASFARIQYSLTTSAGTGGSVSGGGTYYHGDSVTVTASPSTGYSFGSWSGTNCSGGASSKTFNIYSNTTCSASFTINQYTLTVSHSGSGSTNPSGSNNYNYNSNVNITATASSGYFFNGWSGNCSGGASTSVTMNSNKSCSALFTSVASCFLPGTGVLMADGSRKAIEDIKVGDSVISYDLALGRSVFDTVSKVFIHNDPTQDYIIVNGKMKITTNHPTWFTSDSKENGSFRPAGDLKIGDMLLNSNGDLVSVQDIQRFDGTTSPLYNLEIASENHNFFAEGMLVHNK